MLRAGKPGNLVLEGQWHGFSAGVFTYALTQALWELSQPLTPMVLVRRAEASLQQWTGPDQQPQLSGTANPEGAAIGYRFPMAMPAADGVVLTAGNDNRPLSLWLGGLPATVLEHLQPGSQFVTIPNAGNGTALPQTAENSMVLKVESRQRLRVNTKPIGGEGQHPEIGQPVYEKLRLLPRDINLVVALDAQLDRVERVDATSALASIPFVSSTIAGEQPADCLFGALASDLEAPVVASLPTSSLLAAPQSPETERGIWFICS
jgi:hypothetical protein